LPYSVTYFHLSSLNCDTSFLSNIYFFFHIKILFEWSVSLRIIVLTFKVNMKQIISSFKSCTFIWWSIFKPYFIFLCHATLDNIKVKRCETSFEILSLDFLFSTCEFQGKGFEISSYRTKRDMNVFIKIFN